MSSSWAPAVVGNRERRGASGGFDTRLIPSSSSWSCSVGDVAGDAGGAAGAGCETTDTTRLVLALPLSLVCAWLAEDEELVDEMACRTSEEEWRVFEEADAPECTAVDEADEEEKGGTEEDADGGRGGDIALMCVFACIVL